MLCTKIGNIIRRYIKKTDLNPKKVGSPLPQSMAVDASARPIPCAEPPSKRGDRSGVGVLGGVATTVSLQSWRAV